MNREEVKSEFKAHLITYLNLLDITPDQIKDDEPLFDATRYHILGKCLTCLIVSDTGNIL